MNGIERSPPLLPFAQTAEAGDRSLRAAAERLEAAFLSEMLKAAEVGRTPSAFGGGPGEDQFSSLLRDLRADRMAAAGGIGLAERLFRAMEAGNAR